MASPQQSAAEVLVALSGVSRNDADAVFGVLRGCYRSDQATAGLPQDAAEGRPAVWTSTFEVAEPHGEPRPTALTAPVTADLQGGPRHVERVRDVLARAFDVQDQGAMAGDQEREVRLRLASRSRATGETPP